MLEKEKNNAEKKKQTHEKGRDNIIFPSKNGKPNVFTLLKILAKTGVITNQIELDLTSLLFSTSLREIQLNIRNLGILNHILFGSKSVSLIINP